MLDGTWEFISYEANISESEEKLLANCEKVMTLTNDVFRMEFMRFESKELPLLAIVHYEVASGRLCFVQWFGKTGIEE